MPKTKWAVANAALAAAKLKGKIKTTNKKKVEACKKGKQSSSESSFVSNESFASSSSGKGHSRSDDSDSYSDRSSDQSLDTVSSGGGQPSDRSISSDSSSSYGCGVYHRRESLSQSSSESYISDDSSSSSESSRSNGSYSTSQSTSSPEPKESHSERMAPDLDDESKPSSKQLIKATSSKKPSRRDTEADVDEESQASSKVSRKSNKSGNSTNRPKRNGSLTPSMYDDEQASMMQRRGGGLGRRRSMGRGGSSRELKTQGSLKKIASAEKAKSENGHHTGGELRREDADDKFDSLLQRVRSQKSVVKDESSRAGIAVPSSKEQKKKSQAGTDKNKSSRGSSTKAHKNKSQVPDTNVEAKTRKGSSSATGSRDASGELSCSYKTTLLANANSNLRSSVTSVATEESADSQNDDASKKGAVSSRFASMMANLKSSNDTESNKITRGNRDDGESDDEHIFEAPKIVDEKGQSKDPEGKMKSEEEDEDEGKRSRFHVQRPSIRQLIEGKSDKSLDSAAQNRQKDASDEKQKVPPVERLGESDEDSDASISTASSGEDQYENSVTNHARMKYPEDEDNSSDDYMEYYGEPAMTILTPITEMGTLESDVETASRISDASDTDSDDGRSDSLQPNLSKTDDQFMKRDRGGKPKNEGPSNMFQVIEHARRNAPDLKRIELDDSGLDDFDTAKLLYSLHENTHVTHVSLARNKLGDASAVSLAKILLGNKKITYVCLRGNNIGNQGATALEKVLRINDTLTHLDINDNDIDSYVVEGLRKSSAVIVPSSFHSPTAFNNGRVNHFSEESLPSREDYNHLFMGAYSESSVAVPGKGSEVSSRPFPEDKNSEALSLLKIFDKLSIPNDENNLFSIRKSAATTQGKNARQLAMSLALSRLDSEWLLKGSTGGPEGRNTLRGRERHFSSKGCAKMENFSAIQSRNNVEGGTSKLKASQSLQKKPSSRWKDSMLKSSNLRNSLLKLSEQSINEGAVPSKHTGGASPHLQQWARSFKKLDPRWQIRKFFNDMSVFGTLFSDVTNLDHPSKGAAIFSVWRPTSADAIAKMMRGDGVGKGLDIKGKSAQKGDLSGYIPFLQIHEEKHKKDIRTIPKGDRTKIFFKSESARDRVGKYLGSIAKDLTLRVVHAKFVLAKAKFGCDPNLKLWTSDPNDTLSDEFDHATNILSYESENPKVVQNDNYAPEMYCIEVSCRVLWEGLVVRRDISRSPDSNLDTGRASQPAYQDMNFAALRRQNISEPIPVLYQHSENDPFDARTLLMAYEEEGKVVPVVSDFDCFLMGSRNFTYKDPMSPEQLELLDWCVSQVEWILDTHTTPESWTMRWLEVLKYAAKNDYYPSMPRFGFGDPTSYSIIEASVHRSAKTCGAVRHGPECFNYFFPQDIDDKFLIVLPGSQIWKYVGEKELISFLRGKVREGFTFPLNPKWLLCDPGWISLFQDLLNSSHPNVQDSLDLWFPPDSGLRERILDINLRFPSGFSRIDRDYISPSLAVEQYERYVILRRVKQKIRGFVYWKNMLLDVRKHAAGSIDDNYRDALKELHFLSDKKRKRLSAKAGNIEDETVKEIQKLDFFGKN